MPQQRRRVPEGAHCDFARGRDGGAGRVADEAGLIGCTVEIMRYRPASVPMVEEFAADIAMGDVARASVVGGFRARAAGAA